MMAPYIGLRPAIRLIVAERLPGGPEHAAQMTDGWIVHLLRGGARETDPKVLESFRAAARALEDAALDATVHVIGVDMTSRSAAPRQIEAHERGNHSLYIRENVFAGQSPFDAPKFCVADLLRVVPKFDDRSSGINKRKRLAVAAEIEQIGLAALGQMRQKDREHKIIEEVKGRHGLKVSGRYVRKCFADAKEQS